MRVFCSVLKENVSSVCMIPSSVLQLVVESKHSFFSGDTTKLKRFKHKKRTTKSLHLKEEHAEYSPFVASLSFTSCNDARYSTLEQLCVHKR